MNLSIIAIGVTVISILIFAWFSYKYECKPEPPDISRFPFNQSTGKERSFVNKTGDSSMWTESARRIAIGKAYRPDWCFGSKTIKETKHTTGSTSGVIEAFFLSAFGRICPEVCTDIIYDGNVPGDICCNIVYDGNVDEDVCKDIRYDGNVPEEDCCPEVVYDANTDNQNADVFDGNIAED
jgi:hypothetical protein